MTLFGWDTSHFDGPLSRAVMDTARREGITFITAKIAEGLADTEGAQDDNALRNARDSGIPFIGGYLIPRTNATPAAQVARWLQLADAGEPWWRSFPGWFWQVDLELWPYDSVPPAVGIECAQRLRQVTGRQVILYASRGQYGDGLVAWDGPLWNADYRASPFYPGDNWVAADKGVPAGWAPYSGKVPAILQYTSSATIAGLTTCDANAFRGTAAEFAAMIGGSVALEDTDVARIAAAVKGGPDGLTIDQLQQWLGDGIDGRTGQGVGDRPSLAQVLGKLSSILSQAQTNGSNGTAILSKLDALATPDPAAVAAALTPEQLAAIGTAMGAELARRLAD